MCDQLMVLLIGWVLTHRFLSVWLQFAWVSDFVKQFPCGRALVSVK